MALFTALNTAVGALQAQQAAMQTIGHNVANANTPGFSRQRVEFENNRPNDFQAFKIGTGVHIARVRRIVDEAVENRLRGATADLGRETIGAESLARLESIFNALTDTDLSSMLSNFFEAVDDVVEHPQDLSARTQLIARGKTLGFDFNQLATQIRLTREQFNNEIQTNIEQVNRLTAEIADLNRQIVESENGGFDPDTANDLRDRREFLVKQLSDFVGVTAIEDSRGYQNVLVGSSYLVFMNQSFQLDTDDSVDDGIVVSTPVFADGTGVAPISSGRIGGLIEARDVTFRQFARDLDVLANSIIFNVNRVQGTGQGLERLRSTTSQGAINDAAFPITINGSITANSTTSTIIDSSLIGFPDLTGRRLFFLDGANALQQRTISNFDSTTGTIFLDEPLPTAVSIGDRFQISDLNFPVQNGSFKFVLTNELTGAQTSTTILVDLDKSVAGPLITDTTLNDIVAAINAINPAITATITPEGRLRIESSDDNLRFSFKEDTSNFVGAMGLNSFFTGSRANTMGINSVLENNPKLLSAALTNNPGDNSNAVLLAGLRDLPLVEGQASFDDFIQGMFGTLGTLAADANVQLENQGFITAQLQNQRERISGVNIDEEATNMIIFQRAFQASARYISVIDQMLETLLNAV